MKLEADKGISIYHAAQQAVRLAIYNGQETELVFNETSIFVSPFSHADDIATIYTYKRRLLNAGLITH